MATFSIEVHWQIMYLIKYHELIKLIFIHREAQYLGTQKKIKKTTTTSSIISDREFSFLKITWFLMKVYFQYENQYWLTLCIDFHIELAAFIKCWGSPLIGFRVI